MNGRLIVFEGLDCSGKTSTIEEIIRTNSNYVYNKGVGSNTFLGRNALRFPCTFSFFSELIYNMLFRVKPLLEAGKTVLQDRYDISISSYLPLADKWYNQAFIKFFERFLIKPDAVVYLYLPLEERVKRLERKGGKYEKMLLRNPELVEQRERRYANWYDGFDGPKIKINTLENDLEETARIARGFIEASC